LTTVVSRVCLDMLRSRKSRREEPIGAQVTEPSVVRGEGADPEGEAVLADSVGVALLVVLDTLTPAERLAFVLHDLFALPFDEIGSIVGRSPAAAKQLASRARRRVRAQAPEPDADFAVQRRAVDAFLAAARDGDFEKLLRVLDPDVVVRIDGGPNAPGPFARPPLVGAEAVARAARGFADWTARVEPAIVNGGAGLVVRFPARILVAAFTVASGRIVEIDIIADPDKLRGLDLD
jgi:Sigma-70, region 4/SnoaL-like domain